MANGKYIYMMSLQTDQQTDIRGHREVTLPIMIVVVGGMEEERWTMSSGGGFRGGEEDRGCL